MACTTEVGCTTTSMRSYAKPNRKCASISSRPLLARVAESIVIFGPICHVGCASASARVTPSSCARVRPRNGPPEAVSTIESTVSSGRPSRHWKTAECSLSTGRSCPPPRSRAPIARSPAATRLSLFASASVTPFSSAQSVAGKPAKPTTALSTTSGRHSSRSSLRSPPTWACSTPRSAASEPSSFDPDASATTSRSGLASMISIAWRPIDPVAPSTAMRFTRRIVGALQLPERSHHVVRRDPREEERVDPVEHATVTAQEATRVLHLRIALQGGLEEVAERCGDRDHGSQDERLRDRQEALLVERDERHGDRRHDSGRQTLPGLSGRDGRRQLVTSEKQADEVRARVAGPDGQDHDVARQHAVLVEVSQEQSVREADRDPNDAQQRHAYGRRRRRALEDERERQRDEQPSQRPVGAAELRTEERPDRAEVAGQDDRAQRPRHPVQLVQGEEPRNEREPEERPAPEVDDPEDERDPGRRDQDP